MRNRFYSEYLFIALLWTSGAQATSLSASPWSGQRLVNLEFNESALAYAQVINATFKDSSLAQNTWMQITLTNTRFENTRIVGTQSNRSEFSDVEFVDSNLSGFKCDLCRFTNSTFRKVRLDGARFLGGTFSNTQFINSDLSRADFVGVRFESCSVDSATAKTVHPAMLKKWNLPILEQP
ncbi:pentapeptide repeat-containing protein [Bdellovibrio bacteriovorus]|uniref:pentapeptide repeat-containing protein n=1 Tax=Bdellovibrio bacteriovorus TaxID=959 RepID=UPI003AA83174